MLMRWKIEGVCMWGLGEGVSEKPRTGRRCWGKTLIGRVHMKART